ncbi:hypothetical protein V6U89_16730 [Micromonospora sp. CPCC 206171]|uniref:hypothetical protein n=1 Tax=Micromonospora sp. CPCC 206171 TaxID=3122405 RepID=UPI002FF27861
MPTKTISTMLRGAGALTLTAALAAAGGCALFGGGSGTPPPPPTTTTISVTTWFASQGAPKCTAGPIQWNAAPLTVPPNGDGTATAVNDVDAYHEFLPSGDRCQLQHMFSSLRPGRWRITVAAGLASGVCESDFPAGTKFVGFSGGVCSIR